MPNYDDDLEEKRRRKMEEDYDKGIDSESNEDEYDEYATS